MKTMRKFLAPMLALVMAMCLGCGNAYAGSSAGGNTESGIRGKLTIMAFDGGYGLDWLYAIADAYERNNPGVTVDIRTTVDQNSEVNKVKANIYVGDILYDTVSKVTDGRDGWFIDITDVWEAEIEGEDQTVLEKMGDVGETYFHDYTDKYFSVPVFDAMYALLYNKTSLDEMLGAGEWKVPATTDELMALCNRIKATGNYPFVYSLDSLAGYMCTLGHTWIAQSVGLEAYRMLDEGKYWDESASEYVDDPTGDTIFSIPEKVEAANLLQSFLNSADRMVPDASKSMDFVKAQAYFWGLGNGNDHGKAAFMANGDWFYSEMNYLRENKESDIRIMKVPVISSLAEKCPSVGTDGELSALIAAIDGGSTALSGAGYEVTQDDFDRVYAARNVVQMDFTRQIMSIAKNARNYELAKDFLVYMMSDEAQYYKSEALYGDTNLINRDVYDETAMNEYTKSKREILKNAIPFIDTNETNRLSIGGGLGNLSDLASQCFNGTLGSYYEGDWQAKVKSSYREKRIAANLPTA